MFKFRSASLTLAVFAAALFSGTFAGAAARADSIAINENSYAAIAYSPSTGKIGYSYNKCCRHHAEEGALKACPEPDARIVCWVNDGFCAIALGDDKTTWGSGWSYGDGASNTKAIDYALDKANKNTKNARVELVLSSDGQYVYSR
jgi:hypothetical protein